MADAMEMMILAFLSPSLHCEWNISTTQQALITTTVFGGVLLAGSIWGRICDKFGRKIVCFYSTIITFNLGPYSGSFDGFSHGSWECNITEFLRLSPTPISCRGFDCGCSSSVKDFTPIETQKREKFQFFRKFYAFYTRFVFSCPTSGV